MRALLILVLLVAPLGPALAADVQTRTYVIENHTVNEAAMLVLPMLSARGRLSTEPRGARVIVTDDAEVLQRIAATIAAWDLNPPSFRVHVRLIKASSGQGKPPGHAPGLPTGLPAGMFQFSSYVEIGKFEALLLDRNSIEAGLGVEYRVRFSVSSVAGKPDRVRLAPFELLRVPPPVVPDPPQRMLLTSISLEAGQTAVLAAAPSEKAEEALLLVLSAEHEKPR